MYSLVDEELISQLESQEDKGEWLFLEPHPDFQGQWKVRCYDPHFFFDFKDVIGQYRAVSPAGLEKFLSVSKDKEYRVAFFEDPTTILDDYESLNEPPDITLVSSFEGTINGLLPYQVQGYNLLKDLNAGVALWDTGTGKTVLAGGLLKHHLQEENFDTAFVVTKKTNKVNTKRKLLKLAEIDASVVPSVKKKRVQLYEDLLGQSDQVVCAHYENFREDLEDMVVLFHDRRILAQPFDAKVLSPQGWTNIGDLKVGDSLISVDGSLQKVRAIHERGIQDKYKLTFSDGSFTTSSADHLWSLIDKHGNIKTASLSQFKGDLWQNNGSQIPRAKWSLPVHSATPGQNLNLPVSPYIVGALLGDGSLSDKSFVGFADFEGDVAASIKSELPSELTLSNGRLGHYGIVKRIRGPQPNPVCVSLRKLGLMGSVAATKFIPDIYLNCSIQNRLDLLAGLIDTDGTVNDTTWRFRTVSPVLADDVTALIRSLGGYARISKDSFGFTVVFSGVYPPLRSSRKLSKATHYSRYKTRRRSLIRIEHTGESQMRCITVSSPDELYITDHFIPTHNCIWDEMPTKLKNRTSALYQAVKWCLFDDKTAACNPNRIRPSWLTQYMLSATPIENDPENWFNCLRLMDPTVYGTVQEFRNEFVFSYNFFDEHKPEKWHKLDKIGLKASHLVHQVDKSDPDIAKLFPEVVEENYYVEWTDPDRKLYNEILKRGKEQDINPMALISLLQMVCDEPTMLADSAAIYEAYEEDLKTWQDEGFEGNPPSRQGSQSAIQLIQGLDLSNPHHGKQEALEYLLCEKHYGEKTLVFTTLNHTLMPTLERRLGEWEISYVRYHGTQNQRQKAEDQFMEDPDCMVFLSSDMGSDSLDLFVGQNVINYNLPLKWSTKIQRQNRVNRASSEHAYNRVYTLMYDKSMEERKAEIIEVKKAYHDGVFKGSIRDKSLSARMTREDLLYILG